MIVIRQYSEKDREQIIELCNTCDLTRPWNDPNKDFDRKKGVGEDLFIVPEYENKIIGTIMGGYDGHRGIMNYLAVSPDFRGKGYGRNKLSTVLGIRLCASNRISYRQVPSNTPLTNTGE